MLQLYDVNHKKLHGLTNYKDLKRERTLDGDEVLSFLYPQTDVKYPDIKEEGYARTKDNEYVIKEVHENEDWTEFVAKVNVEGLKGKDVERFETVEQSCTNAVNLAIVGTGWTIGSCDVAKKRTVRKQRCNSYDILQEIRNVYKCEFKFDAVNKKIYIYQSRGSDKGTYFTDQLNLKKLDVQSNSYDYITRLIPLGKDGLTIESANGGVKYIENKQYSNKVITAYWEDNRYAVAQSLKDDATLRLNELSKPRRAYRADVFDLAKVSETYSILDYDLGDIITLTDNAKKVKDKQRIVKIIEYLEEPERNQVEIANRVMSLEDLQIRFEDSADTVESVTTPAGEVIGSKIDGIDWSKIENVHITIADVQDLNAVVARVGGLEATRATITQLEVATARIDTLETNSATITQLNASNARIDTLETKTASIESLVAQKADIKDLNTANAKIDNLTTNKANVADLTASNARINTLEVNSATITQLNASNAKIANLEATTADINTILAKDIFVELATAGKIIAGSSIIAEGAIGDAQISNLNAVKITSGTVDTSKVTIQGANGRLKITGNRLQVFAGTTSLYERVSLGDVNGDGSVYGFRVRGADGTTVLLDENGVKREGITDGSINNKKIADDANISGTKLDIASVVTSINNGTTTIQGSKIYVDNQTLDVSFSTLKNTIASQGESISSQSAQITALDSAIKLKVSTQDFTTYKNSNDSAVSSISSRLSTTEASISVLQGQIVSKVTQTDIDNSINAIQVGGRNLLLDSAEEKTTSTPSFLDYDLLKETFVDLIGEQITISFDAKALVDDIHIIDAYFRDGINGGIIHQSVPFTITGTYKRYSYTIVLSDFQALIPNNMQIRFRGNIYVPGGSSNTNGFSIKNVKIEKGTKATDWTPAPEDVQGNIDTVQGNVDGTNEALSTRINQAETVIQQTKDEISLKADKTVTDELGNVVEQHSTEISTLNNQFNVEITRIDGSIDGVKGDMSEVKSYMHFDETSLTLGKSNSPMQVSISNEELDFLDNGKVVAYVNGQKMYIDSLEVLSSLIVGQHKIEKYDNNITLIRWVGGN